MGDGEAGDPAESVLDHVRPDDWVFVAHHKSGTTIGRYLVTALCAAAARTTLTYTFREAPQREVGRHYQPRCHLLNKIYNEDASRWLDFVREGGKLVHFMRSPAAMVASGYLFHLRGSEIHWTGSAECSRDLCTLPENTGMGISKHAAEAEFQARKAAPWLSAYGCPAESKSYNDCLNRLDVAEGLRVEERRAGSTISTMLDFDELARTALPRSGYHVIVLPSLTREKFNGTVRKVVSWLGHWGALAPTEAEAEAEKREGAVVGLAYREVFGSLYVAAIKTSSQKAIDHSAALSRWKATLTPQVREYEKRWNTTTRLIRRSSTHSRSMRAARRPSPLFDEGTPDVSKADGRGIVTCTFPPVLRSTASALTRLAEAGTRLPVQIFHMCELKPEEVTTLRKLQWASNASKHVYDQRTHIARRKADAREAADARAAAALRLEGAGRKAGRRLSGTSLILGRQLRQDGGRQLDDGASARGVNLQRLAQRVRSRRRAMREAELDLAAATEAAKDAGGEGRNHAERKARKQKRKEQKKAKKAKKARPWEVVDLCTYLDQEILSRDDEMRAMRSYIIKPLALLASRFNEVLLIDHDTYVFRHDLELLFQSAVYRRTGMLIFRDRVAMGVKGQPLKQPGRFVRQIIRRRLGSAVFLPNERSRWWPSRALLDSSMATGISSHEVDSSMLLLSKRRNPRMVSVLYELHARYRHELYANLHGDKETFWLACELAGPPKQWRRNAFNESGGPPHCGLSPLAGGEMGQMLPAGVSASMPAKKRAALMQAGGGVRCLRGNLAHHHPDTGALIHCNCKWPSADEPPYTHVSLPTLSSTARRAQRDVFCSRPSLRVVSTGSIANADAPWLTLGVEWRQNTNAQLRATKMQPRACMAESATETISGALRRLSGKHATPPPKWETPLPMGKGEKLEVIGDRATCDSAEYRGRVVADKDLWRRDGEAAPPPLAGGSRGGAPMTHWPVVAKPDAEAAYERGAVDSGTCMVDRAGSGMVHCLPSLLCVGLAKAGTAELQGWINTHPSFVTAKVFEPHFFDTRLLWAAKDMGVVPTEALARTWTAYASLFPTPASALGNVMAFEKTPFGGLHGFTKKVRTIMGAHSAQPKEPHLALTSARTFADVRQRQRLARIIARGKKIGKKLKGKEAKNESAAVLTNVLHEVPHLVAQLLPSARLVIMLRDPVTMAPSRFMHCLRTTARPVKSHFRPLNAITNAAAGGGDTSAAKLKLRAKEMPTATERCGGEAVGELEASLVMTGLLKYSNNGTGPLASSALPAYRIDKLTFGPPTYRSADGQRLQRTRRISIIDDYLQLIGIWYAAFPRTQLLIGFLEELASDAPSFMNRVLKLAGLPEYGWPDKVRLPNSTRYTYSLAQSKSASADGWHRPPKGSSSQKLDEVLREALTPTISRFKLVLPCLNAPWAESPRWYARHFVKPHVLSPHGRSLRRLVCGDTGEYAPPTPRPPTTPPSMPNSSAHGDPYVYTMAMSGASMDGTIGVCWTRNRVSGVASGALVEREWAELHTSVLTFHRSKEDYPLNVSAGDVVARTCLFTEATHEQVDEMMERLSARWGSPGSGTVHPVPAGKSALPKGGSLFSNVFPAVDPEAYLLKHAASMGSDAPAAARAMLAKLGGVDFRGKSSLATKFLSRLGRILHIAHSPYEVTLFLDDDVAFCPSAAPLASEALAAAARADGLGFKPDVRMVERYQWRRTSTWTSCSGGGSQNATEMEETGVSIARARAQKRADLVRACLREMPKSLQCRVGEPRDLLRQGPHALGGRAAGARPIRWCKESGWTDRGCAACTVECSDRVDAAGAGQPEKVACAPFSALGGASDGAESECGRIGVNGGAIFVRRGPGSKQFSTDWADAYMSFWLRQWQQGKAESFGDGWAKDQGPLAPLLGKACAAQKTAAAAQQQQRSLWSTLTNPATPSASNDAPRWTVAPLLLGLNARPLSGDWPSDWMPTLIIHHHNLLLKGGGKQGGQPSERLLARINAMCKRGSARSDDADGGDELRRLSDDDDEDGKADDGRSGMSDGMRSGAPKLLSISEDAHSKALRLPTVSDDARSSTPQLLSVTEDSRSSAPRRLSADDYGPSDSAPRRLRVSDDAQSEDQRLHRRLLKRFLGLLELQAPARVRRAAARGRDHTRAQPQAQAQPA